MATVTLRNATGESATHEGTVEEPIRTRGELFQGEPDTIRILITTHSARLGGQVDISLTPDEARKLFTGLNDCLIDY